MKNFVITVARGFGSGGRAIAAKLADELNIHSYDNRILTLASQYSGYPEHYFKEADETLNGSLITQDSEAASFSMMIFWYSKSRSSEVNLDNSPVGEWRFGSA